MLMGNTLGLRSYKRILGRERRSILRQPKNCLADMEVSPLGRRSSALEKLWKVYLKEKSSVRSLKKFELGLGRLVLSAG